VKRQTRIESLGCRKTATVPPKQAALQSVGPVDETSDAGRVEVAGLAATTPRTLREGLDPEGRRIRLNLECWPRAT
jgi:hypothetical protein